MNPWVVLFAILCVAALVGLVCTGNPLWLMAATACIVGAVVEIAGGED